MGLRHSKVKKYPKKTKSFSIERKVKAKTYLTSKRMPKFIIPFRNKSLDLK